MRVGQSDSFIIQAVSYGFNLRGTATVLSFIGWIPRLLSFCLAPQAFAFAYIGF